MKIFELIIIFALFHVLYVESVDKDDKDVFIATNEWQVVKKGKIFA